MWYVQNQVTVLDEQGPDLWKAAPLLFTEFQRSQAGEEESSLGFLTRTEVNVACRGVYIKRTRIY